MNLEEIIIQGGQKSYETIVLKDHRSLFTKKEVTVNNRTYHISDDIIDEISRMSGVPKSLTRVMKSHSYELWVDTVISMCDYYYTGNITLFLNGDTVQQVLFDKVRPLLNTEFLHVMSSLLLDYQDIVTIDSFNYKEDSNESDMTVYRCDSHEYLGKSYRLGVVFFNDEYKSVTCRQVVEVDGVQFYLPSKYFNLTAARYLKTSDDRGEALSQLVLRVLEMMSKDSWYSVIPEVAMNILNCEKIKLTYEEYKQSYRTLSYVAAQSELDAEELRDKLSFLDEEFSDFNRNYPLIDEKKSSYIWRCSALSDSTIMDMVRCMNSWAYSSIFYPETLKHIRYLIGDFIMLSRISTNLAKRKS